MCLHISNWKTFVPPNITRRYCNVLLSSIALLIEYLILTIVDSRDSYGYEISQTIKLVADIKESTLYPILKRLEKAGYVTTYSQEFQGRKRKYYSITLSGKEQMHYLHTEWNAYRDTIDGIIEGRIRH